MASSAIAQTAIVVCIIDMIQPVYIHVYVCCLQADVCGVQDPLKTYYTHTSTCTCNMYAICLHAHVPCLHVHVFLNYLEPYVLHVMAVCMYCTGTEHAVDSGCYHAMDG